MSIEFDVSTKRQSDNPRAASLEIQAALILFLPFAERKVLLGSNIRERERAMNKAKKELGLNDV